MAVRFPRMTRVIVVVGLALWLAQARASGAVAPPVALTFLHFNDVYEIGSVQGGASGGLARVATVLDRLRRGGPVLSTLGGDFLSPSAIGTAVVDGEMLAGRQMVDVLNATGLDWATLGNHEFDVSEAAFRARLAEARFGVVVSNVTDARGQRFPHTVASAVVPVRVGGRVIRIGLFGLTIDSNRKPWVAFTPALDAGRAAVDALRGKVDAIVALTHQVLAADQQLVQALPEIDLVLGGHEHENWLIRRGAAFTPIVKADANVRSVAVVTLRFPAAGARPTVETRLEVIDSTVPPKPAVEARVTTWVRSADAAFRRLGFDPSRLVAMLTMPLDGRETIVRNTEGAVSDLVLDGIRREAGDVDLVLLNGGTIRIDDVLPPGPVTEYDVLRMLPFGGTVLRARIDGRLLAQVLDVGQANRGSGGFLHVDRATRTAEGWAIAGMPIQPDAQYRVAMPEYLLSGNEQRLAFFSRDNPSVHDVETLSDIRVGLIQALAARFPPTPAPSRP